MHSNILQRYGYSPLSDSNYKIPANYHKTPVGTQPSCKTTDTPDKENVTPYQPLNISPVLPGSGSGYVASRLTKANQDGTDFATSHNGMMYTAYKCMDNEPKTTSNKTVFNKSTNSADDSAIEVEDNSQDHILFSDMSSFTDSSVSTQNSTSPHSTGSRTSPSGSEKSPPITSGEPTTSLVSESKQTKKNTRTNYTNEQIQKLLKIFHENPYPDSEMMETIGLDLGVPESKIKIWFQNKRARWRRRVNNSAASFQQFMPMSPMLSPVSPYGFMPQGHMMTSSPTPMMYPGYYAAMQAPTNQISPTNNAGNRNHMTYQHMASAGQQLPFKSSYQPTPSTALPYAPRDTSPLSAMSATTLPYNARTTPPLSSMTSAGLSYSLRETSPVSTMPPTGFPFSSRDTSPVSTMPPTGFPFSSRDTSPVSTMPPTGFPFSSRDTSPSSTTTPTTLHYSRNSSPLSTMMSHNNRYSVQHPQYS